jgi:hypothetical protein
MPGAAATVSGVFSLCKKPFRKICPDRRVGAPPGGRSGHLDEQEVADARGKLVSAGFPIGFPFMGTRRSTVSSASTRRFAVCRMRSRSVRLEHCR